MSLAVSVPVSDGSHPLVDPVRASLPDATIDPVLDAAPDLVLDPVLEVAGLTSSAGGRVILRDVSLSLIPGEIVAILGPSGAGKSTLFDAMVGLRPSRGRVSLGGVDVGAWPVWQRARKGLGYVPQTPSVLLDLSVRENLETLSTLAGRRLSANDLGELAASVMLSERLDVTAGHLSGGERRRLELARARLTKPRVLLCDEPFAGVDPRGIAMLTTLLEGWAREGLAIAISDHHVDEALALSSAVHFLIDGSLGPRCTPSEFVKSPDVIARYLGAR